VLQAMIDIGSTVVTSIGQKRVNGSKASRQGI